jgi:alkylation response protein AidB-like acyl-CoA dehydrogenase
MEAERLNPFARSDEQQMLADNLRRLMRDTNDFTKRRDRLASVCPDRLALWPAMAEHGVIGAAISEALGGYAGDARTISVILFELGAALAIEPYLATAVIVARLLQSWNDRARARAAIAQVIAGELVCVLVQGNVRATRRGDQYVLSGDAPLVRHGEIAQQFIVTARTPGDSLDCFWVSTDQLHLTREPFRLIDAAGAARIHLSDAVLPATCRMQFDQASTECAVREALQWGILGLAAEASGIVHALNRETFAYLNTRKQFGTVLGSFQALQHRAADMWIAAEELTALIELAIDTLQTDDTDSRDAVSSALKVLADKASRRVGNEAVQLHGGMGVSDELIVSHYFRRLAAMRNELGTEEFHRLRFAARP